MDPQGIEDLLSPERLTLVGILVAFIIAFIRGWIVPGWVYKERDEDAEHQRDLRDNLLAAFHEQVIPALVRSTDALEKATKTLERYAANGSRNP